jgi:hypothetical protein
MYITSGYTAAVELAAVTAGKLISSYNQVLELVVAPDDWDEMNTRATVAVVAVLATLAVGINLT